MKCLKLAHEISFCVKAFLKIDRWCDDQRGEDFDDVDHQERFVV